MRSRLAILGLVSAALLAGCAGSVMAPIDDNLGNPNNARGTVVSSTKVQSYPQALLTFFIAAGGVQDQLSATTGADLYRITYNTIDASGNPTVASGAVVVPQGATSASLVSYQHSTATAKNSVPSLTNNGYEEGEFIMAAFAGSGKYVLAMADYLGLGSNPGLHPFLQAQTEASASLDMIKAARQFLSTLAGGPTMDNRLFLAGYSQGGHATMALTKTIQETTNLTVTASAPMAGPYDLANTQMQFSLHDPGADTDVFLSYVAVAYNSLYNLYTNPNQAFIPPYDTQVPPLFGQNNSIDTIAGDIPDDPTQVFQPSFITALETQGSTVNNLLLQNSLYNWAPTMPMRLFHALSDNIVSYQNSVLAQTTMNGLGATQVTLVDVGNTYTHAEAMPPATAMARLWFDTFLD
ncbi:MAG: hypothetical protein ACAH95_13745 [Fimbriimonas sp.]